METKLNNQNEEDYTNVFSQISGNKKMGNISQLKNNLSDLQQSVSLLKFYATRGKINSKNKKIKIISPIKNQTELRSPNTNAKTKFTRGILKNLRGNNDFDIRLKKKNKKAKVVISQISTNDNTKTQFPKINNVDKTETNKNLFNTDIDYKEDKKKDSIKIIMPTNSIKNESNSRPKNKNMVSRFYEFFSRIFCLI